MTARLLAAVPSLRRERIFAALRVLFARASEKGFSLLHFSVQGNHLHLLCEADDSMTLARGIQRLLSRVAMTVNALARRSGRVWRDRHHRRVLTCPRQVMNAYVYVLFNEGKHLQEQGRFGRGAYEGMDPFTSWVWFGGWADTARPSDAAIARAGPPFVVPPDTWLARTGWRTHGLLCGDEVPRWW